MGGPCTSLWPLRSCCTPQGAAPILQKVGKGDSHSQVVLSGLLLGHGRSLTVAPKARQHCRRSTPPAGGRSRLTARAARQQPSSPVSPVENEDTVGVSDQPTKEKEESGVLEAGEQTPTGLKDLLQDMPQRYKICLMTSLAFVICNMDKVNMSVAIIPMSHAFDWSTSTSGLVQSSFFYGYALSQLPGGWLASIFGGRTVLTWGVFAWSAATAAVPAVAAFLPGLLFSRLLVGLGEGVSPPAATDLVAKTMLPSERARAVAVVFGGLNIGSVAGLLIAPQLIEAFGWESVFYLFGIAGVFWCAGFNKMASAPNLDGSAESTSQGGSLKEGVVRRLNRLVAREDSADVDRLRPSTASTSRDHMPAMEHGGGAVSPDGKPIPWKAFFTSTPVWAMIYAHFCGNWGHFTLLAWLPTYFNEVLGLDLTSAAAVSIFPPLSAVCVSSLSAPLADKLISEGWDVTLVRKIYQTIAFLGPATCMSITCLNPDLPPWAIVATLTTGLSLGSFALSGLFCTHQDISPKYAGVLLGITNTAGAIPGIIGVALTGVLVDATDSWTLSLFSPTIFFYFTGALVWNIFASSEPQNFDLEEDT